MKKVKAIKVSESLYKVTLNILGKEYTSEGSTIPLAISKLHPGIVRGRAVLVVEKNDYRRERILQPIMLNRLFNTRGMSQEVTIKNITSLFI